MKLQTLQILQILSRMICSRVLWCACVLRWLCACDVCCGVCCVWCFVWCVAGVWCRCRVRVLVVSCWVVLGGRVASCGGRFVGGCCCCVGVGVGVRCFCCCVCCCVLLCCCVVVCCVVCVCVWCVVCGVWCVGVWCVVNYSESRIIVRGAHFSKKKNFVRRVVWSYGERVRLLV